MEDRQAEVEKILSISGIQTLLDILEDAICVLDIDHKYREIGRFALAMIGLSREDVIGGTVYDLFPPNDAEFFDMHHRKCMNEGVIVEHLHKTIVKDKIVWFQTHLTPIRNNLGKVVGLIGLGRDVTEFKQLEARLMASSERYKIITETAPGLIFTLDAQWNITFLNPFYTAITGIPVDQMVGKSFDSILKQEEIDRVQKALQVVQDGKQSQIDKLRMHHFSGDTRYVNISFAPIRDADGLVIGSIGVGRDVTAETRLSARLLEQMSLETVGRMAEGLANDFNNFLVGLIGNASLLKAMVPASNPLMGPILRIEHAANKASELTQQLLAFSRGGRGEPRPVYIDDILSKAISLSHSSIARDVEISIRAVNNLPQILADPTDLQQVFVNLILNANEAMPEGGTITISVDTKTVKEEEVPSLKPGEYIIVEVNDTGIGIEMRELSKIFQPFYTTKSESRGMGLAAAYGIITKLGGTLTVRSTPGEGSTFTCYIKTISSDAAGIAPPIHPGIALLVDDEDIVRETVIASLSSVGINVLATATTNEALQMITNQPSIDVVILDMRMPGIGVESFVKVAKNIRKDLKIILTSGADRPDEILKDSESIEGFISKPFVPDQLVAFLVEVRQK